VTVEDVNLGLFPTSKAELAIVAVDSSFFEIYAKDPQLVTALQHHFKEVRLQDPASYFHVSGASG
jgi:hypothetical protein